jgi:hypothetical protein
MFRSSVAGCEGAAWQKQGRRWPQVSSFNFCFVYEILYVLGLLLFSNFLQFMKKWTEEQRRIPVLQNKCALKLKGFTNSPSTKSPSWFALSIICNFSCTWGCNWVWFVCFMICARHELQWDSMMSHEWEFFSDYKSCSLPKLIWFWPLVHVI